MRPYRDSDGPFAVDSTSPAWLSGWESEICQETERRMKPNTMKAIYGSLILLCLILCSCNTVTNRVANGRDFDETKVNQIKKASTTADGVVALYGEPDSKQIVATHQVMWHYTYLTEEHKIHTVPFSPTVEHVTGYRKNLDILLQDDIVMNFTYVKTPIETEKESSAGIGN
jgi:outer membrane protein assembly factor BamE (lipoprotein component of BamABCDE complex)